MTAHLHPAPGGVGAVVASRRPALKVADVFRRHGEAYAAAHVLTPAQGRVLGALRACRTAVLGGHLEVCDTCGFERPAYNSCRNRHCPGCQALAQREWLEKRLERVLPTHHFHVVFTLPAELRPVALRNGKVVYGLIMRAAHEVLSTLGRQRLGATLGVTEVLHTWTREMLFHPHVHCVVTGGGLAMDGSRWVASSPRFLFPVAVMRKLFRGVVRRGLLRAHERGELDLGGACAEIADPRAFKRMLRGLHRKKWVVYCKPPFAGAKAVFAYLGRYTHRVAISDHRLVALTDDAATFRTRGDARLTVAPDEFIRRFLLHVLPDGFHKIRHFGLYSSTAVRQRLPAAAAALGQPRPAPEPDRATEAVAVEDVVQDLTGVDLRRCPCCETGRMLRFAVQPQPRGVQPTPLDTS